MNSLTLCRCHPRLARKLYHKTHYRNQCTNEVDNQWVSCYSQVRRPALPYPTEPMFVEPPNVPALCKSDSSPPPICRPFTYRFRKSPPVGGWLRHTDVVELPWHLRH